jgi:hypothetical protein
MLLMQLFCGHKTPHFFQLKIEKNYERKKVRKKERKKEREND